MNVRMPDILLPPRDQFLREDAIRGGMDLLLFANTRHLKHADETLARLGLGRAHHRVLYFVRRKPDLTVTELLCILAITKQSFSRVLRELMTRGMIEQRAGETDRRHRLLRLTPAGFALENALFDQLRANVAKAYAESGGEAVAGFWTVLQHLIGEEGRMRFAAVQGM